MAENPRARVLFSTGSLYLIDVSYCFALAKEAGYDGVEIMCDDRWSTRDPRYLNGLSETHDLPIMAVHTPFSPKIPGWGYAGDEINRIERTLELAESVGAEVIVVHLPPKTGSKSLKVGGLELRVPSALIQHPIKDWIEKQLPDLQSKTAVKIALENMPRKDSPGFTGDPTWWNEVDSWSQLHPYLTMDTTHWATKGVDPLAAYQAARGRIAHVHLSNYYNREEHHLPHKGTLKLGKLLEHMAADGYAGTISLEVQPQHLEYKDMKAMRHKLKEAAAFMRLHLGQSTSQPSEPTEKP
ncbi:MAG: sugar phosphate isomerase/epimerase [Anaerolineae bacterium]